MLALLHVQINRYIVGCKYSGIGSPITSTLELIDTQWDVNPDAMKGDPFWDDN